MAIPAKGNEYSIISYGLQAVKEGDELIRACNGYSLIQACIDKIISKKQIEILAEVDRAPDLATTTSNRFRKIYYELAAGMTDTKPFWDIRSMNHNFDRQAEIFSDLSSWWYTSTRADIDGLTNAIKWALVAGTGYVHLTFDPREDRRNIYASSPDPRDVLPIRPTSKGHTSSLQDCLGVVVRENRTVSYVRELFPDKDWAIVPDRGPEENIQNTNSRAGRIYAAINSRVRSPIMDAMLGDKPQSTVGKEPSVDLFTLYIKDFSVNESGAPVYVGDFEDDMEAEPDGLLDKILGVRPQKPSNNWSYTVQPGDRLYPRGRMVIFTRSAVLYDGPSMYWHGMFPIVKLTLDPTPTEFLGTAPMWDLLSLQDSLDWNLRVIDDHNAQVAQPGLIGDQMSIDAGIMKKFNTRRAGWKLHTNMPGQSVQVVNPPALDSSVPEHVDRIKQEMEELAGLLDLKNLNALNQIPSSETIDKMIESKSLLLQGRSRVIEAFMREFAEMMLFNFAQFYTQKMTFTILGPNSQIPEMFDFDPGSLVPDFIHSGDFDEDGNLRDSARIRGPMPRYERAKELIRHLAYYVAPGSLLAGSAVTKKLLYLQLRRDGLIDIWTLAKMLDIPGYGEPPAGADTIPKKIAAEFQLGIGLGAMAGGMPPGGGPPPGGAPVGPSGGPPREGHPPTAQKMPHFADNGKSTVVSES